jgi:ribonuclease E
LSQRRAAFVLAADCGAFRGRAREDIQMKRMLINATQREELRVAIVDGQSLYDLDLEIPSKEQKKANIYKGRITRVEPSLEACFVDYGADRHGFLPLKEISRDYFAQGVDHNRAGIRELLKEGQEILVQVEKEERGNKGAALTTFVSLAGRYLVLMPNNPRAGGVSRRIEGDDRANLKEVLDQLKLPDEMGLIIRTAGMGREAEELQWDLDYLLQLWKAIDEAAKSRPAPFLIYQESKLIIRALRDYLRNDIGEILIDSEELYNDAREFVQQVMPQNLRKLKVYKDTVPLFSRFQIETQIENAYERSVRLPSGGSIVIDQTEALTAIDINSAKATKGGDIEETAFNTNCEAAVEIARQLRIRDAGGLIVIDFIDMDSPRHQREVEDKLRDALRHDRARVQIGKISRFGLLEMSRQRLRPSLGEATQAVCPRCEGHGRIRSVESLSLSVLRLVEEQAMKENTGQVLVQAPHEVANFLLNEKRASIVEIEKRQEVPIIIVADDKLETPHFEIQRIRAADIGTEPKPSYERLTPVVAAPPPQVAKPGTEPERPAVAGVVPASPAPVRPEPVTVVAPPPAPAPTAAPGFFARMMSWFNGAPAQPEKTLAELAPPPVRPSKPAPSADSRRRDEPREGKREGRGQRDRDRQRGENKQQQQRREQRPQQQEAGERQAQQQRKPQQQERPKREVPAPVATAVAPAAAPAATVESPAIPAAAIASQADGEAKSSRRRGRRGGRRRRRGEEKSATAAGTPDSPVVFDFDDEDADRGAAAETLSSDKSSSPQRPPMPAANVPAPAPAASAAPPAPTPKPATPAPAVNAPAPTVSAAPTPSAPPKPAQPITAPPQVPIAPMSVPASAAPTIETARPTPSVAAPSTAPSVAFTAPSASVPATPAPAPKPAPAPERPAAPAQAAASPSTAAAPAVPSLPPVARPAQTAPAPHAPAASTAPTPPTPSPVVPRPATPPFAPSNPENASSASTTTPAPRPTPEATTPRPANHVAPTPAQHAKPPAEAAKVPASPLLPNLPLPIPSRFAPPPVVIAPTPAAKPAAPVGENRELPLHVPSEPAKAAPAPLPPRPAQTTPPAPAATPPASPAPAPQQAAAPVVRSEPAMPRSEAPSPTPPAAAPRPITPVPREDAAKSAGEPPRE